MGRVNVASGSLIFPEARRRLTVEHGHTLEEIVRLAGLPARLDPHAVVSINDAPVQRAHWPKVKPKAETFVSIGVKAADGDTMRMLVPAVATMAAGYSGIGGPAGWLLQAGVYVASTFIGSALWPPKDETESTQQSIADPGNGMKPNGTVPRVPSNCGSKSSRFGDGGCPLKTLTAGSASSAPPRFTAGPGSPAT